MMQLHKLPCARAPRVVVVPKTSPRKCLPRRQVSVVAGFDIGKIFGKKEDNTDAAKKAIEDSLGGKSSQSAYWNKASQEQTPTPAGAGGGFAGMGGSSGGGGGWSWSGGASESGGGEGGSQKSIWEDTVEVLRLMWLLFWNFALFLLLADVLHRSLDWAATVEMLFVMKAPAQALERINAQWYKLVEWLEYNLLGWDVPGYVNNEYLNQRDAVKYDPHQEKYFHIDTKRFDMTLEEQAVLNKTALDWDERIGGFPGDIDEADVQRVLDKYYPQMADLEAFRKAKAEGREQEYWSARPEARAYFFQPMPGVSRNVGKRGSGLS